MKCHYEVLGVERTASTADIKAAYRKLALQWHPDKNADRAEECHEVFTVIQAAYDVLNDPHERAWYDRHRDAILKGGIDGDYKDEGIDLYGYFTSTCYRGCSDEEKGFYTVYRQVFETIVREDLDFVDDPTSPDIPQLPSFGFSYSDYESVVGPFYGAWSAYSTLKSYAWLDKYDIRQAENRRVVRAMEKENKRERDGGRRERNELVRELVAFVRKRDPRVKVWREGLQLQRAEQAKRVEENRRSQIARNKEMLGVTEQAELDDDHAAAIDAIEADLLARYGIAEQGSSDEENAVIECVVCDKIFRSHAQLSSHQRSAKHKANLQALRAEMTAEDFAMLGMEEEQEEEVEKTGGKKGRKGKKKRREDVEVLEEEEQCSETVNGVTEGGEVEEEVTQQEVAPPAEGKKRRNKTQTACGGSTAPKSAVCQTCNEWFESKSRLFAHLQETGHATLKTTEKSKRKGKTNR